MIGVSLPRECFRPFGEVLSEIRGKFGLWEVVSEMDHDVRHVSGAMSCVPEIAFQVHAPFSDINLASLNIRHREQAITAISETIQRSADAGAKVVTVHPGIVSPMGSYHPEKAFEASARSLKSLAPIAEDSGIVLAVENMPHAGWAFMTTAEEARKVCEGTGLGLCFDIGHAHIAGTEAEFFELADLFANVHLHDNNGGRDEHLTVGDGGADFAGLRKVLGRYRGNVVIEGRSLESAVESKKRLEAMGF
ncbi:MAG: sugar phosphate isomerase/epimerase family protein [Methanobacteriota archaeon]